MSLNDCMSAEIMEKIKSVLNSYEYQDLCETFEEQCQNAYEAGYEEGYDFAYAAAEEAD